MNLQDWAGLLAQQPAARPQPLNHSQRPPVEDGRWFPRIQDELSNLNQWGEYAYDQVIPPGTDHYWPGVGFSLLSPPDNPVNQHLLNREHFEYAPDRDYSQGALPSILRGGEAASLMGAPAGLFPAARQSLADTGQNVATFAQNEAFLKAGDSPADALWKFSFMPHYLDQAEKVAAAQPWVAEPAQAARAAANKRPIFEGVDPIGLLENIPGIPSMALGVAPKGPGVPRIKQPKHKRVKSGASKGQYVGAPKGVDSPQKLAALRRKYKEQVMHGIEGRDWYDQTQSFIHEAASPAIADSERKLAEGLGVFSQTTGVDPNLGHEVKAWNQRLTGAPLNAGRFPPTQTPTFERIMQGEAGVIDDNLKRGAYARNLLGDFASEIEGRPVNDIWQGRAFGYRNADGTPWDAGFSASQHDFMDKEMSFITEGMNAEKAGGFANWDEKNMQASGWTGVRKDDPKVKPGDAEKSYSDYINKRIAYGTEETVPMRGGTHMGLMADQPEAIRNAYSAEPGNWMDEQGHDVVAQGLGLLNMESQPFLGAFRGQDGLMQYNPGMSTPWLIGHDTAASGDRIIDPASHALGEAMHNVKAPLGVQAGSAGHASMPQTARGNQLGVDLSRKDGMPVSKSDFQGINDVAEKHGFFAVDRGNGTVAFINNDWSPVGEKRAAAGGLSLAKELKGRKAALNADLKPFTQNFDIEQTGRISWYADYEDILKTEGKGLATQEMMSKLGAVRPAAEQLLGHEPFKKDLLNKIARDEKWAVKTSDTTREDIQNLRRLIAEPGTGKETFDRVMRALKEGAIALPAVLLMLDSMPEEQPQGVI